MDRRISIQIVVLLLIIPLSTIALGEHPLEYDGDTVYINDENVLLTATPHTIQASGWVEYTLLSKKYAGDIDVIFGFNTSKTKPTQAQIWCNYTHTEYVEQKIQHIDEIETENGTVYFVWNETTFVPTQRTYFDWKPFDHDYTKISYNYQNMTTWYLLKDVPIQTNKEYKLRIWLDVEFTGINASTGKYWYAIKPSSETLSQAILNNHFYAIDPWWNSSWGYYKFLTICRGVDSYQLLINISKPSTALSGYVDTENHCNNDFGDIRFTDAWNETLSYWIENYTSGVSARFWVKLPDNITTSTSGILMYYGNAAASSIADGNDTFIHFDDFDGAAIDTFKWDVTVGAVAVANGNAVLDGTDRLETDSVNYGTFDAGKRFKCNSTMTAVDGYVIYVYEDATNYMRMYVSDSAGGTTDYYVANSKNAGAGTETIHNHIYNPCIYWNRYEIRWQNLSGGNSNVEYWFTNNTNKTETFFATHGAANTPDGSAELWYNLWSPTASTYYINWSFVAQYNLSEPYICLEGAEFSKPVPPISMIISLHTPYNASTGVCPCNASLCINITTDSYIGVNITIWYSFDNVTYYGADGAKSNYTNGSYCWCLCIFSEIEYNTTYSWYVETSQFANPSDTNTSAVYYFVTASSPSLCEASVSGGGGGATGIVGLIGIFGILGWILGKKRMIKIVNRWKEK